MPYTKPPENEWKWRHESLFLALVQRGEKLKDLYRRDLYVRLWPGSSAILYSPLAEEAKRGPLHVNPRSTSWDDECQMRFEKLKPNISFVKTDNKGPNNSWDWYQVKDWDGLAAALNLEFTSRPASQSR